MKNITYMLLGTALLFTGCSDLLDRPELNRIEDSEETYWRNENDFRLFANDFYTTFFVGYNSGFATAYAPLVGFNFSDDLTALGAQTNLLGSVPTDAGGPSMTNTALRILETLRLEHPGPRWNFYWVRKSNTMIDRLENIAKPRLSEAEFNHWMAVGRFFRGYEYSRLVSNFGDVPYFDKEVVATDFDQMYKARDNRGEVMDRVYADFQFVLDNMREDDGVGFVNRYAAAALISNLMLFEGSWQH